MKKITLSLMAFLATSAMATTITLYQDKDSGAIYTKPGPNRVKLGEFISKDEVYKTTQEITQKMKKETKATEVFSKVPKLKINGVHYLGFTHINYEDDNKADINRFETRRNYLQLKAYWNKKDYARITLDTHQDDTGDWKVRLKYAYLYLDNVLPYTGVEFGQVHRPWIDWEEHHGWLYRSIAKTFVEEHEGAHLTNSADQGINFKTKTDYFTSEIGLFNGEGYHGKDKENTKLSFEWRLTAHLLGTGKKHVHTTSDTYADISFLGQINPDFKNSTNDKSSSDYKTDDFKWYAIHAVYNQPMFLLAGMYATSKPSDKIYDGHGWSINGEFRPVNKWSILARYDKWTDESGNNDTDRKEWIAGIAYKYNKNVKFIANTFVIDPDNTQSDDKESKYMLTTEVKW
ncbi:hypothetical protein [Nitrosophilus kaiyonis]|uniref:hypothetical protein n=1 Tax=Nitrosophilus kaiyonis TaxID=2930200 RepID=UPI00249022D4|nr:hypothetical protein [Nitrosophilus kaiyonis]